MLLVLVPSASDDQSHIRASLVLIEQCLSVISDSATVASLKDFQTCVVDLEVAVSNEKLPEADLLAIIEV